MWKEINNSLYRELVFSNFKEAFRFMTQVADLAEELNHHPDWSNCWNTVKIRLTTHDAGDIITDKDHLLAKKIDLLYQKFCPTEP